MFRYFLRNFALLVCAALAVAATARASETFPVIHHEPITLRVLDGRNGKPLAHVRLALVGGYNQRDLAIELWYGEAQTNAAGEARLPDDMANLPFLRVWAEKEKLCQPGGRHGTFSVERIRGEGFSTANHCGDAIVADAPGVFTVYVQGNGAAENLTRGAATAEPAEDSQAPSQTTGPAGMHGDPVVSEGTGGTSDLPVKAASGTAGAPAAYQEMCQPDE